MMLTVDCSLLTVNSELEFTIPMKRGFDIILLSKKPYPQNFKSYQLSI